MLLSTLASYKWLSGAKRSNSLFATHASAKKKMPSASGMRMAVRQVMEGYSVTARARVMVGGSNQQARCFSSFFPPSSEEQQKQLQEEQRSPINPPDAENPDPATLREQWRYAISLYSKWYSHAWGTAILAGLSFFALGWFVKGGNPLPSSSTPPDSTPKDLPDASQKADL